MVSDLRHRQPNESNMKAGKLLSIDLSTTTSITLEILHVFAACQQPTISPHCIMEDNTISRSAMLTVLVRELGLDPPPRTCLE